MRIIRLLRSCWAYIGAVLGEQDYQNYVSYLKTHHPCTPIPTEREYWRMRYEDQERNPQGRCC